MPTPIVLNIYGTNDELKKTYSRSVVPWGVLKKAMRLMRDTDADADPEPVAVVEKGILRKAREKIFGAPAPAAPETETERTISMLEDFIVDFFGDGLTREDLKYADTREMMSVLHTIMARANDVVAANPTRPN